MAPRLLVCEYTAHIRPDRLVVTNTASKPLTASVLGDQPRALALEKEGKARVTRERPLLRMWTYLAPSPRPNVEPV